MPEQNNKKGIGVSDFPVPAGGFQTNQAPSQGQTIQIPGFGAFQPDTAHSSQPFNPLPSAPNMPPIAPGLGGEAAYMNQLYSDDEFIVNTEEVELPSQGLLYPNGKRSVVVQHLTAQDENILTSRDLIMKGTAFDTLLRRKILDKDIDINTMLAGDKMAVMIWLRINGYGADYHVEVTDPETYERFPAVVDLTLLKPKPILFEPDHEKLYNFQLPVSKRNVRFRVLTDKEVIELGKQAEAMSIQGIDQSITLTLKAQIQEVDGKKDKLWIGKFVDTMTPRDSRRLQLFMGEVYPGLDMSYTFTNPNTGRTFRSNVPIEMELFYPTKGL